MSVPSIPIEPGFLPDRSDNLLSLPLATDQSFFDIAAKFAHQQGTVVLASGGTQDCARYNILGVNPWLSLSATATHATIETGGKKETIKADPLQVLQYLVTYYKHTSANCPFPLCAGLLGYLSYDLKDCIELLPRTGIDDLRLPHLYMVAPSVILIEDRQENCKTIHVSAIAGDALHRKERFLRALNSPAPHRMGRASGTQSAMKSCFTYEEYLKAIDDIRDYIVRGHVYQVNLSQRFETSFTGDPFDLFVSMFERNPAPFYAYVQAGDHQIVSTSPERFIELRGNLVETRPIKGTRPRGTTPEEDLKNQNDLTHSPKDDGELSMIVDLMRNDLGKVCNAGSVKVREHKRVEAYENVFHTVSIVEGVLENGKGPVDLIRATFPGGSITGCPKIRAMEIIDELEPFRRHIYTGSIGYIGFHDTMDLSIAIRTATITGGKLVFSVGGGIVYDSNPEDEYRETLHKGKTLMNAIGNVTEKKSAAPMYAWCNGTFRPQCDISVSVDSEGFLYGYGIFETLRVQDGWPCRLAKHIDRFNRSWEFCFGTQYPDITWNAVISHLLELNGLSNGIAAVKILAAAGIPGKPETMTMLVTARRYTHRLESTGREGLYLATFPHRRYSPLSSHKTMNYMFCKIAQNWAKQNGADEALIVNADGSVCETATANILCVIKGVWHRPESEHVLTGTMEIAVRELLAKRGCEVTTRWLSVDELKGAEQVFLTNALMGMVPVLRIDNTELDGTTVGLCKEINTELFSADEKSSSSTEFPIAKFEYEERD